MEHQPALERSCSALQRVLSSRSSSPAAPEAFQTAFPGVCYLSCAFLVDDQPFAVTSNLVERTRPDAVLVPSRHGTVGPSNSGALFHVSWPAQWPDLAILRQKGHWDSVLVVPCPCPVISMPPYPPLYRLDPASTPHPYSARQHVCTTSDSSNSCSSVLHATSALQHEECVAAGTQQTGAQAQVLYGMPGHAEANGVFASSANSGLVSSSHPQQQQQQQHLQMNGLPHRQANGLETSSAGSEHHSNSSGACSLTEPSQALHHRTGHAAPARVQHQQQASPSSSGWGQSAFRQLQGHPPAPHSSADGAPPSWSAVAPDLPAQEGGGRDVIVLGLEGHGHDLERTLVRLQLLATGMAPAFRQHRQQWLDKATQSKAPSEPPQPAHTPFAAVTGPAIVRSAVPDQTRRRENSGSLPLDQILSRRPSPSNISAQLHPDSSSDGVLTPTPSVDSQRVSSSTGGAPEDFSTPDGRPRRRRSSMTMINRRRSSRLRASSLPSELECGLLASLVESDFELLVTEPSRQASEPAAGALPKAQASDRTHGSDVTDTAASGAEAQQAKLELPEQLPGQAQQQPHLSREHLRQLQEQLPDWAPMTASVAGPASAAISTGPMEGDLQREEQSAGQLSSVVAPIPAADDDDMRKREVPALYKGTGKTAAVGAAEQQTDDSLVMSRAHVSHGAELATGTELAADLDEGTSVVKMKNRLRQHPWLLHFSDRAMERDYAKYHAQQMLKVDIISIVISMIIYLNLGFSATHAFARRVPLTFGLTLGVHFFLIYFMCFQSHSRRLIVLRERLARVLSGLYIATQVFMHTPNALAPGITAVQQMWRPMWLARYSNTLPLFTSSVCFMVRLHVHIPCQLINFAMSAVDLPYAICKAGYAECSIWKCVSIGVGCQFLVGLALTTFLVALNEKRLRGMYIRKQLMDSHKKGN